VLALEALIVQEVASVQIVQTVQTVQSDGVLLTWHSGSGTTHSDWDHAL